MSLAVNIPFRLTGAFSNRHHLEREEEAEEVEEEEEELEEEDLGLN